MEKYNTRYSINYELKDKVDNPVNDDTVFIHYVGPTKPRGMSGLTIRCHVVLTASSFSVE
ncbi:glycosyltransferase [Escherichia coli]|uniref:glycosyltransferase n=1 Tax=Escherichia coli TaxID=562 RepID=UPI0032C24B83